MQIPHAFFARKAAELGFTLPKPGDYAVGALFMPKETAWRKVIKSIIADQIKDEGLMLLGWREVPSDNSSLGETVKPTEPAHMQVFIGRGAHIKNEDDFERRLYILRKSISQAIYQRRDRGLAGYYPVSLSCRTVVYKGMFLADQLGKYYPDLSEPDFESALALVHQRFSTNTFPAWSLAHPYRMIAHNGEINTLRGNVNWMAARQASVHSELYGKDISRLWPISYEGQSDTACFDNGLEFLVQGGYSLPHAVMMMIPEAWAGNPLMDEERRSFYEYHAAIMEPWDGPAAIAFTDGRQIGATLDRNGLRPARYLVTSRRPHRDGVRNGRAEDSGRDTSSPSGGCSPARCCWSTSNRAGSFPTTRSRRSWPRAIPIASGSTAPRSCWRNCRTPRPRACAPTCRCSIGSRRSATPRKTSPS